MSVGAVLSLGGVGGVLQSLQGVAVLDEKLRRAPDNSMEARLGMKRSSFLEGVLEGVRLDALAAEASFFLSHRAREGVADLMGLEEVNEEESMFS